MPAQSSSTQGGAPSTSSQHSHALLSHGSGASSTQASPRHSFRARVFNPNCKKQYDTLMLRNVDKESVSSPLNLRKEIWNQFGSEVVSSDLNFAVGYMKGNSKLSIISAADVDDAWDSVKKGESVSLWCNKVRVWSKRKADDSECNCDSDDSSDVDITYHKSKKRKKHKKKKQNIIDGGKQ